MSIKPRFVHLLLQISPVEISRKNPLKFFSCHICESTAFAIIRLISAHSEINFYNLNPLQQPFQGWQSFVNYDKRLWSLIFMQWNSSNPDEILWWDPGFWPMKAEDFYWAVKPPHISTTNHWYRHIRSTYSCCRNAQNYNATQQLITTLAIIIIRFCCRFKFQDIDVSIEKVSLLLKLIFIKIE